ncbi:hypothetical protein GQ53DRAFT_762636 [Thozetella sp. PMI_491]|nr:hypothetical protein GQ53DRAFT_762636 [Thozetella sp. PMI_491]
MARQAFNIVALGALFGLSVAQSTVVSLILPAYDAQTIEASVVAVDATATTYFLTCPTGESSNQCGLADGATVVNGPSVLQWDINGDTLSIHVSCAITTDTASCTESASETGFVSQTVEVISQLAQYAQPVTVTAGLDLLSASGTGSAGAATASPTATGSGSSTSATQKASLSTTASASGSASAAASSSTHTGGAPAVTQRAVLAGVAAVLGGVMMA